MLEFLKNIYFTIPELVLRYQHEPLVVKSLEDVDFENYIAILTIIIPLNVDLKMVFNNPIYQTNLFNWPDKFKY